MNKPEPKFKVGDLVKTSSLYLDNSIYTKISFKIIGVEYWEGPLPGYRYDVSNSEDPHDTKITKFWHEYLEFDFKGLVKRATLMKQAMDKIPVERLEDLSDAHRQENKSAGEISPPGTSPSS